MDCSIIIVNYNTREITEDCVVSIQKYTQEIKYEIILIDNASTDGSGKYFSQLQGITFIQASENLGFGRANNIAASKAKGEFLFFLNSDTLLTENSLKKMVDFFRDNEEKLNIGALGVVLTDLEGNYNGSGSQFPTCKKEIQLIKTSLPKIGKFFKSISLPIKIENVSYFKIDYVIGADLMMKNTVFKKLTGFAPEFFMYYEESDLQKRMTDELQLYSYIYTGTKIIHLEDGTGKQLKQYSNRKRTILHKSKNIYLKKHDAENFSGYKLADSFFLFLNRFNAKYTSKENSEYISEIKKTHK